ncbi:FtsK/SpoIIIE domain-containing protein [Actinocorallia sp. B10E7]|uniref:FtsK/SpoIIIE domain-containing protein n=1 Tax=Actinocorallia sp. B10E7 TaxID=3153558 RepID=UPI00325F65B7
MSANENLVLGLVVLAAAAAGAAAWRHYAPASFWLWVGFPLRALVVYLTWGHVAYGCKLTRKRHRVRLSLEAVPLASAASEITTFTQRRRVRRVPVDKAPRLGLMRPTALGWRVRVHLHDGQIPADYVAVAERLAHAWRVNTVRVVEDKPGRLVLVVNRFDALTSVEGSPETGELLRVRPGMLETGQPWVMDFRIMPHWLNAGATQSGKSTLINAVIRGLAPQPVALVGFDLKGGVELTPYAPRLSALATTRTESVELLGGLVQILEDRMRLCRKAGARNVWQLPVEMQPVPVVVLVDEVAELFLMADKSEKDEVAKTATALLRVAQLGRAFAVYLIVSGQRIGSDLGPGVTALRAQLTGRVCHRVNDPETANMTLGDLDPAALDAARAIAPETPGVAVVAGQDGGWHRARSVLVTEDEAEHAARTYAHLTPAWSDLVRTGDGPSSVPDTWAA